MRAAATLAIGLALALNSPACRSRANQEDAVQATVSVGTAVVSEQPFTETIGALGVVTGRPGHVAALAAPAPARIVRINVAVGQHVDTGAVLVELDSTGFAGAARAAEAALAAAEQSYERTRRLVDQGIAPRKDLDQARADLERARSELANARRQRELARIRSPIRGVITRLSAVLGATADPSQVLVEIADPGALDLLFTVAPGEAAAVHPGARVWLAVGASAVPESLGVGTVVDVSGAVDSGSRGIPVRVEPRRVRRPLRLGETVFGEIVTAVHARSLVIPGEALVPDGEGFKVFVVDSTGVAHARRVVVAGRSGGLAAIAAGVAAGERIVTAGAYALEDGARVVPQAAAGAPGVKP